jgi:hypothetical protein
VPSFCYLLSINLDAPLIHFLSLHRCTWIQLFEHNKSLNCWWCAFNRSINLLNTRISSHTCIWKIGLMVLEWEGIFFLTGDQQQCWEKSQKGWEPIVNIIEVSVSLAMTKQTWTTVQPIKHASMENTYFCWQCKIKEYFLSYGHWTCLGALGRLIVLYNILFFL